MERLDVKSSSSGSGNDSGEVQLAGEVRSKDKLETLPDEM